ncbi:MAG TPA: hypothetical protein VIK01_05970 [Polyangiaceae bacterium]
MSWEEFAKKKIAERRWDDLRQFWAEHVSPGRLAGARPSDELGDIVALLDVARESGRDKEQRFDSIQGLNESILGEGLFLIHAAVRVIGSAQSHVGTGARTWSHVSAYQGAFFAAKGILRLCGVAHAEVNNKTLFIDVFSPRSGSKQRKGDASRQTLVELVTRLEHRQYWIIFLRVLRGLKGIAGLPKPVLNALAVLDPSDFARQRNALNYRCSEWPSESVYFELSGGYAGEDALERIADPGCEDFTVALALVVLRLAAAFVDDLAAEVPSLREDQELMRSYLAVDEHHLYRLFAVSVGTSFQNRG